MKTLQDYVKLYGERGLQFEPRSKWEYSNYGFLLLGVLIEKVSEKVVLRLRRREHLQSHRHVI